MAYLETVKKDTQVRVNASFSSYDGEAADPTVVKLIAVDPAGTATTYTYGVDAEVVRTAVGVYHALMRLDAIGSWWFEWRGEDAGGPIVADDGAVLVKRTVTA